MQDKCEASGLYRIETKVRSVGIGGWGLGTPVLPRGATRQPHGYGTYSPCDLAMEFQALGRGEGESRQAAIRSCSFAQILSPFHHFLLTSLR
jgi:hypothetical protein